MKIPTKHKCYKIMLEMEIMDHIAVHSINVSRVALFFTDRFIDAGIKLNRNLIRAAALLHDITKTRSFKTGENHAITGGELIESMGYSAVGEIISQHIRLNKYNTIEPPKEVEVVNYADKRVLHDQIVSLKTRRAYILEQYGNSQLIRDKISEVGEKTEKLEAKFFKLLSVFPENLKDLLNKEKLEADILDYGNMCESFSYSPGRQKIVHNKILNIRR